MTQVSYLVSILEPHTHIVHVRMELTGISSSEIEIAMPSWSPGSYLMREYARHVRQLRVTSPQGEFLDFNQLDKGRWTIHLKSDYKFDALTIDYEVSFSII